LGLPLKERMILWLLLNSGCRVSEALNLHASDVTVLNDVLIRGSKGSADRLLRIPFLNGIGLHKVSGPGYLFEDFNRYYIYRLCKLRGLYVRKDNRENYSVTHSFRNYYAWSMQSLAGTTVTTSNVMGHKSRKSILHYAPNSKK
jgi:integrase